jgi:hypothetical protein
MEITFVSASLLIMKMMHLGKVRTGRDSGSDQAQNWKSYCGQVKFQRNTKYIQDL